jgi:hypothetical protein
MTRAVSNTFSLTVVDAAAVPSYLSGLADWGVRTLTPAIGAPEARYCYPTEWRNGTTGGVPLNFKNPAWPDYNAQAPGQAFNTDFYLAGAQPSQSGAVFDPTTKKLHFHGGGHAAGPFNGIISFDFSGDAAPLGWSYVEGSASSTLNQANPAAWEISYPGSPGDPNYFLPFAGPPQTKPISVHTANQHVMVPSRNRYYRFGGASFGKGQVAGTSAFYWDFTLGQWLELPAFRDITTQFPADARLSPDESKIFVWSAIAPGDYFVTLADTPAGHTRTVARANYMVGSEPNPVACLNDDTGEYLVLYGGSVTNPQKAATDVINWGAMTASHTLATLTGPDVADFSSFNIALWYDQGNACFWAAGVRPPYDNKGVADNSLITTLKHIWKIVRVSAAEYAMTKVALPNWVDLSPLSPSSLGLHGRIAWFEDWRTLMIASHNYKPVYALKIPTGI